MSPHAKGCAIAMVQWALASLFSPLCPFLSPCWFTPFVPYQNLWYKRLLAGSGVFLSAFCEFFSCLLCVLETVRLQTWIVPLAASCFPSGYGTRGSDFFPRCSSDLQKAPWAWQDVMEPEGSWWLFHQEAAVPVGEAGERAGIPPICIWLQYSLLWVKALQRVLQAGEKHPWAASVKSSFPVPLAGSLKQIHSLCQPRGALPLVVLPPAAVHTLLLLIFWRRQQHALFWMECACPECRELCGHCFRIGRWIW